MHDVGDVFRTEEPFTSTGSDAKSRWFIYLGRVSCFEKPLNIFLCTTTTQLQNYIQRPNTCIVYFYAKDGIFTKDCLIDLESIQTNWTQEKFETFRPVWKGRLSIEKLKEIVQKIKNVNISRKILKDILESFRLANIPTN